MRDDDFYLNHKLKNFSQEEISVWADKTVGFSIDELKETVLAVACLGYSLDDIVKRIAINKGTYISPEDQEINNDNEYEPDEWSEETQEKLKKLDDFGIKKSKVSYRRS